MLLLSVTVCTLILMHIWLKTGRGSKMHRLIKLQAEMLCKGADFKDKRYTVEEAVFLFGFCSNDPVCAGFCIGQSFLSLRFSFTPFN